jgi:CO dehydrogenase maturation factor
MRIFVFGKGGSGKTTIAASIIKHLSSSELCQYLLAVDADMNVHLGTALGLPYSPEHFISGHLDEFRTYFRGTRNDVEIILSATPPSHKSRFIKDLKNDPLLKRYVISDHKVNLLTVGTYNETDKGNACYHGKLGAFEILLNHTIDGCNDFIVADSTAGIDSIATTLHFASDINVFVVEPTHKSIQVYKDFIRIGGEDVQKKTYVIVNKLTSSNDEIFARNEIKCDCILGMVEYTDEIRRSEQGDMDAFNNFVKSKAYIFSELIDKLSLHKRDWKAYFEKLVSIYEANCKGWYNHFYNKDMFKNVEKKFSYEQIL